MLARKITCIMVPQMKDYGYTLWSILEQKIKCPERSTTWDMTPSEKASTVSVVVNMRLLIGLLMALDPIFQHFLPIAILRINTGVTNLGM